ncbi:hypothetical protein ACFX13_004785 [Malus domestica]
MSAQQIASHIEDAEIYHGEALCRQKSRELLDKMCLPRGLLPLDDVVEFGYNHTSGFVWLKQKKRKEQRFRAISKTVSYDTEVMGFVEEHRMRRLSGVKSKELLIWVSISDIYVDPNSDLDKITFANGTGLSRSFPATAFGLEGEDHSFAYIINPILHSISSHHQLLILPKQFHSSTLIKSHRNNVEIYHGESVCKQKLRELLEELALPKDLFRADIDEMGYHRPSGFVRQKQRKKSEQKLKATSKTIVYNAELTMLAWLRKKYNIGKLTSFHETDTISIPSSPATI